MYQCKRCGCYVDAGELHNGVCEDCIAEQEQLQAEKEQNRKMIANNVTESDVGQMVLIL